MNEQIVKLLQHARELLEKQQPENAVKFFEKAVAAEPNNSIVLDEAADAAIEAGMPELAVPWLQRSISLAPQGGSAKYMSLAQLMQGDEALKLYQHGLSMLQHEMAANPNDDALKKKLCQGLCSIAELYMTDLCDEDNAEAECERHLLEANKYDNNNAEVHVQLANFRLCQQKPEQAVPLTHTAANLINAMEEHERPSIDCRVGVGKLFIELQLVDQAIEWLEALLDVDDEYLETWYLLAFAHHQKKAKDECVECLEAALGILDKEGEEDYDPDLVARVRGLAEELDVKGGAAMEDDDEMEDGEED